jgi:hypothetical protein
LLFFVLLEAVRRNPLVGQATNRNIEDTMKKWFVGAKDRKGGREERRKQKNNNQE